MFQQNFTYETTFTDEYMFSYINGLTLPYAIVGIKTEKNKYVTINTERDLTLTEKQDLNALIQNYSDFSEYVVNSEIIALAEVWGKNMVSEFKNRNIARKNAGTMARQELDDIIREIHDSFVYINMKEGSLDTLHGLLWGFPEQTIGEGENAVVWPARAPFNFVKVWQEDVDWIKAELNTFLASL